MKIIAIYGSARKKGFSSLAVDTAVSYFENKGQKVRKYYLVDMDIQPCMGCFACRKKEGCVRRDDMSELFKEIVESDFVIFSSPIYCFSTNSLYNRMFERLYPMLGGGMALGAETKKYTQRYPGKKCMMIFSQGAPALMCSCARRRTKSNLRMNGFDNVGTVVIDSTYTQKGFSLTDKQIKHIQNICHKLC